MFDILEADIVVFQETKIQKKDLRDDMVLVPGWDCFFSLPKVKKGSSFRILKQFGKKITTGRIFWCCDLHPQCDMRPDKGRRRYHRSTLPA